MTLDEMDKCIGLVIARGILGQRGLPVESLWDTTWVSKVCGIQRVVEELTWTTPGENTGKNAVKQRNLIKTDKPSEKKRKTCATIKYRNRTMDLCNSCRGMVCGKCAIKICPNCVD